LGDRDAPDNGSDCNYLPSTNRARAFLDGMDSLRIADRVKQLFKKYPTLLQLPYFGGERANTK